MADSRRRKPRDPPYWLTGPKGGKSANGKPLPSKTLNSRNRQQSNTGLAGGLYDAVCKIWLMPDSSRLLRITGRGESRIFTALSWTGSCQRKPYHLANNLRSYDMASWCKRLFCSLVMTWRHGENPRNSEKKPHTMT